MYLICLIYLQLLVDAKTKLKGPNAAGIEFIQYPMHSFEHSGAYYVVEKQPSHTQNLYDHVAGMSLEQMAAELPVIFHQILRGT
jgi:hypothetical protein